MESKKDRGTEDGSKEKLFNGGFSVFLWVCLRVCLRDCSKEALFIVRRCCFFFVCVCLRVPLGNLFKGSLVFKDRPKEKLFKGGFSVLRVCLRVV